jgi:hypothetical protein
MSRVKMAFLVQEPDGETRTIRPAGRDSWALVELINAGALGITSLENPAPRLASYIHKLRHVHRLNIESLTELHHGDFAGKHSRYVLRQHVELADDQPAPDPTPRHNGEHAVSVSP